MSAMVARACVLLIFYQNKNGILNGNKNALTKNASTTTISFDVICDVKHAIGPSRFKESCE
jgi:hypothetical protein